MLRNRQDLINQIKTSRGQAHLLVIPRLLVDFVDDLDTALLLFYIIYWSERTQDPDGWFYKAPADWQTELGLSEYEVRRGINKLIGQGFLVTRLSKTPGGVPTSYYRFDWLRFSVAFGQFLEEHPPGKPEAGGRESASAVKAGTTPPPAGPAGRAPSPAILPASPLSLNPLTVSTPPPDLKKEPAIKIYRRITGRWPSKASWPAILEAVSQSPNDLAFWEEVIMQFVRRGENLDNVADMLDFFSRGELPELEDI